MEKEKPKGERFWAMTGNLLLAAAVGAIISIPFWMAVISRQLDRIETIYFAVEACKSGAEMDACRVLRGEPDA